MQRPVPPHGFQVTRPVAGPGACRVDASCVGSAGAGDFESGTGLRNVEISGSKRSMPVGPTAAIVEKSRPPVVRHEIRYSSVPFFSRGRI